MLGIWCANERKHRDFLLTLNELNTDKRIKLHEILFILTGFQLKCVWKWTRFQWCCIWFNSKDSSKNEYHSIAYQNWQKTNKSIDFVYIDSPAWMVRTEPEYKLWRKCRVYLLTWYSASWVRWKRWQRRIGQWDEHRCTRFAPSHTANITKCKRWTLIGSLEDESLSLSIESCLLYVFLYS